MKNPENHYGTPEALLRATDISRAEKIDLLREWEYDQRELSVAQSEGMQGDDREGRLGDESNLLPRIQGALKELGADSDGDQSPGPSRQRS